MEESLPSVLQLQVAQGVRRRLLGSLLLDQGLVTAGQLEGALVEVERGKERLGEVLVQAGVLTRRQLAAVLAEQAGLEFVDLDGIQPDPAVTSLVSERFASRVHALPLRFADDRTLVVAVGDPTDVLASDDLQLSLGLRTELVVAERDQLDRLIQRVYRQQDATMIEVVGSAAEHEMVDEPNDGTTTAPAIQLVNSILGTALEEGASDVHFEPQRDDVVVRARIDGVMRQIATVPKALQLVLRILQRRTGERGLADLGMSPSDQAVFERAIKQPYGAIIACGPTGSGKTTTLYGALSVLNEPDRALMTIEDPVEYQMAGIGQIEVNVRAGLSFARGLRTILRSDPDVLLVGEIRDDETAHIAIQAAMTGHLVLTTLHTHNAASSIERLKDMGIEPSLLSSSVNCIVAQRLTRRLCTECRESYRPDDQELESFSLELADGEALFRPRGCGHCAGTGYRGRAALYEVMPVQGQIRRLLGGSTDEIFAAAVEQGMTTLRQDGLRLVRAGVSSLDEIRRVTGDRII